VYPIVLCVSVRGPVYALVYLIVLGRSSCCIVCLYVVHLCSSVSHSVVCVCMWSHLFCSVSHSVMCVYMWFHLCSSVSHTVVCVCMWSRLCASVSHNAGSFFLFCCVFIMNVCSAGLSTLAHRRSYMLKDWSYDKGTTAVSINNSLNT
jgi:hypothetical protein